MKFSKLFASTALALAVSAGQAAVIAPSTGNGELMAVLTDSVTKALFVFDLGVTVNGFDSTMNQSFDLASSPFYNTIATGAGTLSFSVAGANSTGPIAAAGQRVAMLTSAVGNGPTAPSNSVLQSRTGNMNTFQTNLGAAPSSSFSTTHLTQTNGSSLETATTGNLSFTQYLNIWVSSFPASMVAAGQKAEFFRVANNLGSSVTATTVTDYYKATETNANPGGFWTLDKASGALSYQAAPVPEASEWAMMLSGLGLIAAIVRRRKSA